MLLIHRSLLIRPGRPWDWHEEFTMITAENSPPPDGHPLILTARWVVPVASPPVENGFIRVENGKISALGRYSDLPPSLDVPPPKPDSLITPGLVNTHLHLEQSFPEAIRKTPDEPFVRWLVEVVRLLKKTSTPEEKRRRCLAGVEELLGFGVTCVNDIASGPESLEALTSGGLRGIVSLEVFHPAADPVEIDPWVRTYEAIQTRRDPRHPALRTGLSPHSPYNVSPAAWHALLAACRPFAVHTHVAEFLDEVHYLRGEPSRLPALHETLLGRTFPPEKAAASPIRLLAHENLLGPHTILAHAVHTDAEDRALLAERGASVAHCPRSNLALHGETLRMSDWEGSGVPMGLGTDGRLSTENLDMRAEARCAMRLHDWSAERALQAITLDGARTLDMADELGSLSPGLLADLVLWRSSETGAPEAVILSESTRPVRVMTGGQTRWSAKGSDFS